MPTAIDLALLPHLRGWGDVSASPPWGFGPWEERAALLQSLPERVRAVVGCEYAWAVLPVWRLYSTTDRRPEKAILARLDWCRTPTPHNLRRANTAADAARASRAAQASEAAARAAVGAAAYAAGAAAYAAGDTAYAARAAAHAANAAADAAARASYTAGAVDAQWGWMAAVYESACPIVWHPQWTTATVLALAEVVWGGDFSALPILADALQDAGCGDTAESAAMLARLRSDRGPHTRTDAAVWMPLGLGA